MLSMVKMLLKGEVRGRALNSHGNYIVDHRKSWKNHGNVFFNFCGNPVSHFSTKTYVVGTQKNRLNETVLLSTQNTCLN